MPLNVPKNNIFLYLDSLYLHSSYKSSAHVFSVVAMVEVSCVSHSSRLERLRVIIKDVLSGHEINGQPIMGHKVPASYVVSTLYIPWYMTVGEYVRL